MAGARGTRSSLVEHVLVLRERDPTKAIPPLAGALVKNEQDVQLLERLAFMARRQALGELSAGKPVSVSTSEPYGCSVKYGS